MIGNHCLIAIQAIVNRTVHSKYVIEHNWHDRGCWVCWIMLHQTGAVIGIYLWDQVPFQRNTIDLTPSQLAVGNKRRLRLLVVCQQFIRIIQRSTSNASLTTFVLKCNRICAIG